MSHAITKLICVILILSHFTLNGQSELNVFSIDILKPQCFGEKGSITVGHYADEKIMYSFDNHSFKPYSQAIEIETGFYQLILQTDSDFDIIDVSIQPQEEISFTTFEIFPANCAGQNGKIVASITGSGTASFPNTGSGTILFNSTSFGQNIDIEVDAGSYSLTAFLNEGTRIDTTINVPSLNCRVYFPNAIYPNSNEGLNKRFIPGFETGTIPLIRSYMIFDRWGSLIYKRENIDSLQFDEWWDGTCFGEPCSPGVYSYRVQIDYESGKSIEETGTITLLL